MIGIFSALGASLSWTYACFIWRSQTIFNKPLDINLLKNLFAFIFFSPILFTLKDFFQFNYLVLLLLSGIIGIGIGDTFYLKSLKLIGTRKTLSIEALSPILAAFSGQIFIKENLTMQSWIGIITVSISMISIIKKGNNLKDETNHYSANNFAFKNYIYSFLSILLAVTGALLSRYVFLKTNLNPLQTTEIRLLGSIVFLLIISRFKINFFINENLSIKSWIGIIIVSISFISILKNKNNLLDENSNLSNNYFSFRNYIFSFLSIFCAVVGALISRYVFLETNLNPLQTTELRLLGSLIFLIIISRFKINFFIKNLNSNEKNKFIISILLGTNIGIYLQQLVFQNLPLGIGWTILSSSPIFSLFLAKREEGKLSKETITCTIFLFFGISLIIL